MIRRDLTFTWTTKTGSLTGLTGAYLMREEKLRLVVNTDRDLPDTAVLAGTLKLDGNFDDAPLWSPAGFTRIAAGKYEALVTVSSAAINTALGVNGDAADDKKTAACALQFFLTESGAQSAKSDTFAVTLKNDPARPDDSTPLALPTPSDWLSARAVRFDVAQTLSDPQKAQALANIGATSGGNSLVKVAKLKTTANLSSLSGTANIDGVAVSDGDVILVGSQSTASQNGLYIAASGAWARSTQMDTWSEVVGSVVAVQFGTSNNKTVWINNQTPGGTIDTNSITFTAVRDPNAVPASALGSTVATLTGGKVPSGQLPSYVDDVLEAANFAALPGTGETGKLYVTIDNGKIYRWSGSIYVEISGGGTAPLRASGVLSGATGGGPARFTLDMAAWSGGGWTLTIPGFGGGPLTQPGGIAGSVPGTIAGLSGTDWTVTRSGSVFTALAPDTGDHAAVSVSGSGTGSPPSLIVFGGDDDHPATVTLDWSAYDGCPWTLVLNGAGRAQGSSAPGAAAALNLFETNFSTADNITLTYASNGSGQTATASPNVTPPTLNIIEGGGAFTGSVDLVVLIEGLAGKTIHWTAAGLTGHLPNACLLGWRLAGTVTACSTALNPDGAWHYFSPDDNAGDATPSAAFTGQSGADLVAFISGDSAGLQTGAATRIEILSATQA